jgi:hypothetical protein
MFNRWIFVKMISFKHPCIIGLAQRALEDFFW